MAIGKKRTMTNDDLNQFRNSCQRYINSHPENSPFHHALMRSIKQTKTAFEDYADAESELRMEAALIDPATKKYVLNEDKQTPAIDPDKAKTLQKKTRELGRKEVEVEIYQATEIPPDLEAGWYQQFVGIVFEEEKEEVKNGKTKKLEVAQ